MLNATLTDDGTLDFATGDTVSLDNCQIDVNGTMSTMGTTFNNSGYSPTIQVGQSGTITPAASTFNLPIYLPYNDVSALAGNVWFDQVEISSSTLPTGELDLDSIGTSTTNLVYVFPTPSPSSPARRSASALMSTSCLTQPSPTTKRSTSPPATPSRSTTARLTSTARCPPWVPPSIIPAIHQQSRSARVALITPATSTFNLPIYLPYNDVSALAGNVSFDQVEINSSNLPTGEPDLDSIGTSTTNLVYVFPVAFTIESGATVSVGPYISVQINSTLTDDGALNFSTGDTATLDNSAIDVNGTMSATDANFANGGYSPSIQVNNGGTLTATNETSFKISSVTLNFNSADTIEVEFLRPAHYQ